MSARGWRGGWRRATCAADGQESKRGRHVRKRKRGSCRTSSCVCRRCCPCIGGEEGGRGGGGCWRGQMSARGLRGESRRSPLSLVFAFVDALRDLFVWHCFTLILFFAVAEVFLNVFLLFVLWFVVAFGVGCCRVVKSKATEKFIEEVNFSPPPLESANVTLEKVCRCDGPRGGLPKS